MKGRGFTLLEVMVAVAILTVVLGILYGMAGTLAQSAKTSEAKITTVDDARSGMLFLIRELRQAADSTVNVGSLPGSTLVYQTVVDADDNGYAVDVSGNLELSVQRTIQRDTSDANGDGLTTTQLVRVSGDTVRVIANGVLEDEDTSGDGALSTGEDANGNNVLDRGFWVESVGSGLRITLQTQRDGGPRGQPMTTTLIETVVPRN